MPAPSGRRAAPMAASTPSMATALTSMPPSLISASTTASSSGRTRAKTSGASVPCARPESGETSSGQQKATSPATDTSAIAAKERGRSRRARVRALTPAPPSRASRTSSTVSHGPGAVTFDTWGAKAGDDTTTSVVGPSATTSPAAMTTTRSELSATNSTSCVDTTTERPRAARPRSTRAQRGLGRGVEAAGRLVEQQHRRVGGQLHGEHQRQLLPLGQVARVLVASGCRGPPPRAGPRRCRRARRSRGRPGRTRRRRCRGRAGRPRSAAPGRPANDVLPQPGCSARPEARPARCRTVRRPLPWRAHSREDLPQPLRPITAVTWPACRSRSTPATAITSPG